MKNTLRLTDTNAASDSGGRTWGLEGNLVWWLIGGLGTGIAVFFLLIVGLDVPLLISLVVGLVPVVVVVAYIFLLRQGKPPGYDRDLLETLVAGNGFGPVAGRPRHMQGLLVGGTSREIHTITVKSPAPPPPSTS